MLDFLLGNSFLSAVIAFAIVLIPAVIVHELGHFLAARAVGITVLEFGIGFPPRVARLFYWRETEFTLNLLPIGGFVRPFGEDVIRQSEPADEPTGAEGVSSQADRDAYAAVMRDVPPQSDVVDPDPLYNERQELAERGVENPVSVYDVAPLPRIFFMSAGALANFLFALLVFILIGVVGLPQEVGVRIGIADYRDGSLIEEIGLQRDDWITAIDGERIANHDDFTDKLAASEGQTVTLSLRRLESAESGDFFSERLEVFVTPELVALWQEAASYVRVWSVVEESPAAEAGIMLGDLIFAFNGESILDVFDPGAELQRLTNESAGEEVQLSLLRDGTTRDVSLVPRVDPPAGQGRMGIGIRSEYTTTDETFVFVQDAEIDYIPEPIGPSINYGLQTTAEVFGLIAEFPSRIAQGDASPEEQRIISVVGVSQLGGVILQDSIEENTVSIFLRYVALISIALGVTNLLPIPALDGGRIVFAVIELIRGKPVAPEREGYIHMIGLVFLLSLGVLVMINDLANPVSDLLP